ncbi:MAG: DUF305 domain-containing protein [Acidimicrobiia bacterium]
MTTTITDADVADAPPHPPSDEDAPARPWWYPGRVQIVAIVVALLFLVGVLGYAIGKPNPARTNDADIGFLEDMTQHHQQAIVMSFTFLEHSDSGDWLLTHEAREIVMQQSAEVRVMSDLLVRFDEEGDPDTAMEWMGMPVPQEEMPGLAAPSEVERLARLSGSDAEELFSRLMIEHHRGGVHMADAAADRAETDEVRELATKMAKAQRYEIEELQDRRVELGFAPVE